ncbi:MAG TPA: hypothetical protein VGP36_00780 [Mycobacteriales bacterium]|jgi:uncharacterized protein YukE|nr:hypothetical protein [Mycobacteriales bacterium]
MSSVTPGVNPADLIPGDPDQVDQVAMRLTRVAASASDAAGKLEMLDADVWSGAAAELYRGAIGDVPSRLTGAATAFGTAAQALRDYARTLRDAQATAANAVRMVERSTPETAAADQQSADALLARATDEVDTAGRIAVERLARAQADAPTLPPPGSGGELALRIGSEHQVDDPGQYVSRPGDWSGSVAEMRYTSPHDVPFAGALGGESAPGGGTGEAGWQGWVASGSGRGVGVVEVGTVVAAGAAVAAVTVIGRRRDRTALGLVGLDEAELRRRREEFGGARHRDSTLGPAGRAARLGAPDAWRTRLASITRPPGTVQHWTGSGAGRVPRASVLDRSGPIDRDVRGAVLRVGRPATEAS